MEVMLRRGGEEVMVRARCWWDLRVKRLWLGKGEKGVMLRRGGGGGYGGGQVLIGSGNGKVMVRQRGRGVRYVTV